MKINVTQVRLAMGGRQPFCFTSPVREVVDAHDHFWLDGDIQVEGEVVNDGLVLSVTGTITGSADTSCHRCLKQFQRPVKVSFKENYLPEESKDQSGDDDDNAYFSGEEIDIIPLIRDTLLLSEPLKILCAENCKGLCLKCGADLNVSPCDCDRDIIDPRLAALQKLLNKN